MLWLSRILVYLFLISFMTLGKCSTSLAVSSLRQIHVVFRHGERTPTETYKNDPYINKWTSGWGQLTNQGKVQMYVLGETLAEVYKGFLPKYFLASEVKVLSSYADRCHMSAQVLLAGMFPPKDELVWNERLSWQPIPVSSLAREEDPMIALRKPCPKYDRLFEEALTSEAIKEIDRNYAELYKYLSRHAGQLIDNIHEVERLYNTLEIEEINNLTLPKWTKSVYPDKMKFLASKTLAIYTDDDYMKRMKGGVFIKHALSSMKKKAAGEKEPSVHLYSVHDLTIVTILRTMGVKDIFKPGFGASFIIELHENDSQYYVKILYRDDYLSKPEELTVPKCPSHCTLEEFENSLRPMIPVDWNEECKDS